MNNDIFRTIRELLQSSNCVLMGNAVNNDGKLYDDSIESLTAILSMQDSYREMLDALIEVQQLIRSGEDILDGTIDIIESAIASALKDRVQ